MKLPRVGRQILADSVRLIDENGSMTGIVSLSVALDRANTVGLDLVEISPKVTPPVCKIIDFGKYKYELKKNIQQAKKKQKVVNTKEIRLRPTTGENDLNVKINQIKNFIAKGNKVKVVLRFRGRENAYHDSGETVIDKIIAKTVDIAVPETPPKREGSRIVVTLIVKENV